MLGIVQAALADSRSCYDNEYSRISFHYIYEIFFIIIKFIKYNWTAFC